VLAMPPTSRKQDGSTQQASKLETFHLLLLKNVVELGQSDGGYQDGERPGGEISQTKESHQNDRPENQGADQALPEDQMDQVYEGVVFWADVILVATPIRWGSASSLYYKMIERMNCIQNQITIRNRVMLRNKVASFIIIGGQDNIQAVAGQMMMFFGELGCVFPQFPFIAHSRGWSAEDMEQNVRIVKESSELKEGAAALVKRSVDLAHTLIHHASLKKIERGGRKAHHLRDTSG